MSSILNTLYSIFKNANPDKSDDEINTQIKSYAQDPAIGDALKDLLPSDSNSSDSDKDNSDDADKGTLTVNPDIANLNIPPANSIPSSFDDKESSSPVTMNGAMPAAPTGNIPTTTPPPAAPSSSPTPVATASQSPTVSKSPAPAQTPTLNPVEAPLAQNLSDNDERQKMLAAEALKRKEGIAPILLGGAGDAISTAATAFGAQAGTPVLDKIVDMESKNIKEDKDQFEENLKNDPSSDVSHSYQKVLGMMMGKPPTDPDILKMSANTIATQLPEVEKFMAKELGLKQIQANKELSMSMQQGNERDRMWNQGVQSVNSVRGDKSIVQTEAMRDGAISAYQAIDKIQKEGRAPNQFEYVDLLGQLWKARTGGTLTNEELKHMDPKTLQSQLGPIATYLTGDPKAITTPQATQALKNFVVTSGKTADYLHDNYMQTRGVNAAASRMKSLYPEDADRLAKMARGVSFSDAVKNTEQPAAQAMTATNPKTGAKIKSTDGGQTWQPM